MPTDDLHGAYGCQPPAYPVAYSYAAPEPPWVRLTTAVLDFQDTADLRIAALVDTTGCHMRYLRSRLRGRFRALQKRAYPLLLLLSTPLHFFFILKDLTRHLD